MYKETEKFYKVQRKELSAITANYRTEHCSIKKKDVVHAHHLKKRRQVRGRVGKI